MIHKKYTTTKLAEWAMSVSYEDINEEVLSKIEDCILDALGCAIVGKDALGTQHSRAVAKKQYRDGSCSLWFDSHTLNATGAAFSNAAAVSMLDIDDGHRLAMGHPGAAVIPTALALAEEMKTSAAELYVAIMAGYEVAVRLGESESRKSYHTGNWSIFGAVITAARLQKLSSNQAMHALAIAAYHGSRLTDLTQSQEMGSHVKESIPWSVIAGISACELAREGFTGSRDALDLDNRFDTACAVGNLGSRARILGVYFKKYSTCRWAHSSIEALLKIVSEHQLAAMDIERVEVETFQQATALNNSINPDSLESAQYSLPYSLAIAVIHGDQALFPMRSSCLDDSTAVDFASRVVVTHCKEMDDHLPFRSPARVTVVTGEGLFTETVIETWGDSAGYTERSHLREKFISIALTKTTLQKANRFIEAVDNLRTGNINSLLDLVSQPILSE